jgi:hypothetical protein
MTAPSGQDIAQHIAAGDLDGELVALLEVIQARFMEGASSMRWLIEFDGLEVAEDDLTLDEAFSIEKAAGCNWSEIEPVRSAAHCRAIIGVCLGTRLKLTQPEVEEKLAKIKVSELLKGIRREEVVPAPLDTPA